MNSVIRRWQHAQVCISGRRDVQRLAQRKNFSQIFVVSHAMELREFESSHFAKHPVIFRAQFNDLAAIQKWPADRFEYLRTYGNRIVPVEISKGATSYASRDAGSRFEQVEIPLELFVNFIAQSEANVRQNIPHDEIKVYLAQHALFDTIPELYDDVCSPRSFVRSERSGRQLVPKYATSGKGDIYSINAWLGLSTHTPLHQDPYHNLFVQLFGSKMVRMFPESARDQLDMQTDVLLKNTSNIADVFEDSISAGLSDSASGFEGHLESGDGLYIPQGWIHSFKGGKGISGSVNWWFR